MLRLPAMKVAIYVRYSSDKQREASIADQFRVCREYANRKGWKIAQEYSDHAMSGATLLRPGFQAMMQSALRKEPVTSKQEAEKTWEPRFIGEIVASPPPPLCKGFR